MNAPLFDLSGRVAFITRSSRGIGFTLARGLAQAGARVILNARSAPELDAAVARLRAEGLAADGRVFDVTDATAVEDAIADIEQAIGAIDILDQ